MIIFDIRLLYMKETKEYEMQSPLNPFRTDLAKHLCDNCKSARGALITVISIEFTELTVPSFPVIHFSGR